MNEVLVNLTSKLDCIWACDIEKIKLTFDETSVNELIRGLPPLAYACVRVAPDERTVAFLLQIGADICIEVEPGVSLLEKLQSMTEKNDSASVHTIFRMIRSLHFVKDLEESLGDRPHICGQTKKL